MKLSRRSVLRAAAATFAAPALGAVGAGSPGSQAVAQTQNWKHALSLFGDYQIPSRLQAL